MQWCDKIINDFDDPEGSGCINGNNANYLSSFELFPELFEAGGFLRHQGRS
jgi:hypothetical protein